MVTSSNRTQVTRGDAPFALVEALRTSGLNCTQVIRAAMTFAQVDGLRT